MNKQRWVVSILLAVSVIVALGLRAWLHPPLNLQAAQLLPVSKPTESYGFTMDGQRINFDVFKGHWVMLFFGYTYCSDICPLELQKLGQVLKKFDESGDKEKPLVVFVSVDPERDKPDTLKNYASYFHPSILGATGTNSELAALANFLGAGYSRMTNIQGKDYLIEAGADMPPGSGDHYTVNHSSRIFIIDPQSRYVGSFASPHDAEVLFTDMRQLIRY